VVVIADQPIYVRNGAINFNRRDEDERDPKIVTYDDYITELKEALIRKDASLDEINLIRHHTAHAPSIAHPLLTRVCVSICRGVQGADERGAGESRRLSVGAHHGGRRQRQCYRAPPLLSSQLYARLPSFLSLPFPPPPRT
jgi:hypothetical protein